MGQTKKGHSDMAMTEFMGVKTAERSHHGLKEKKKRISGTMESEKKKIEMAKTEFMEVDTY